MLLKVIYLVTLVVLEVAVALPFENDHVDMNYVVYKPIEENSGKSPLLLLHGMGGSHLDWDMVIPGLVSLTGRTIYAADLRNHGDSDWNDCCTTECMAWDVHYFLEKHNISKINIIGHSLGGKIAVHCALKCPSCINSIVVEDMRANGYDEVAMDHVRQTFPLLLKALDGVEDEKLEDAQMQVLKNYLKLFEELTGLNATGDIDYSVSRTLQIHRVGHEWKWKMNVDLLYGCVKNPSHMLTPSDGLYDRPSMFIYGSESQFKVGEDKDNILKLFPSAKLVEVKGGGHLIHEFCPEFLEETVAFYNGID